MRRVFEILAYLGNVALLFALLVLWANGRFYGVESVGFFLLTLLPVLNMAMLWSGPDGEERKLRRLVAKAELRQRLRLLEKTDNNNAEKQ